MALSSFNNGRNLVTLVGKDGLAQDRRVQTIVRPDGITAVPIDGTVTVTSTFGFDQNPDSFFKIINTGGAGTTWTLFVRGTSSDPSAPDRDLPDFTKVFTVLAGEVGDELKFRDRIITELNTSTIFRDDVLLKSQAATDRGVVHIFSVAFSLSAEFYERPAAGDFTVTIGGAPGDGVVVVGFDNLIARSKPVTITTDKESPHRLGQFGITGDVNVVAKDLDDLFVQYATDDGTPTPDQGGTGDRDLLVDGSVTQQTFFVAASLATDLFIQTMIFRARGNGIKLSNFFAKNTVLTNGVRVEIKSDNTVTTFFPMRDTSDFKNTWAALSGTVATWDLDRGAATDEAVAVVKFENPFIIKVDGAFGAGNNDYIRVLINDDLSSGNQDFDFLVRGFEKEP